MNIWRIFFFLLGGVFASFINVLVLSSKSPRKNLQKKRSKCESCKKELMWWELIPIFSWIGLGGRCSKCEKPIPLYHVISEMTLSFMFLGLLNLYYSSPLLMAVYMLIILVTYFFSMYDIKYGIVPNRWIFPIAGGTLAAVITYSFFVSDWQSFLSSRLLAASGYSLFFVIMNIWSKSGLMPGVEKGKQGFGGGDSKFAILIGLILGVTQTIISGWIAIFSGALVGVILLVDKKEKYMRIPFIPFMTFGLWCSLLWGDSIIDMIRLFFLY